MVGVGVLMLAISWYGWWRLRKSEDLPNWLAHAFVWMSFSGWVAVVAGWYVTEIGRQPYLVHGVLTTAEAVTKLPGGMVFSSLMMYLFLYVSLIIAYIWAIFYMARQADQKAAEVPTSNATQSALSV
jgi:cytochrome d ubiquinol oxidase subunit I